MSNISDVENNESQWRNDSVDYQDIYSNYHIAYLALDTIFTVAGTPINVWFLTTMLLSPGIRSQLRNKLICAMLVANLIESAIICPIFIIIGAANFLPGYYILPCHFHTVHVNIYHIQNFLGNWYIFILVCVFVAQVVDFDPKFPLLWKKISNAVIVISPFVFVVFFVPLTTTSYGFHLDDGCLIVATGELLIVFKTLDTIVPQALTILLLVVTAVLKRRRCLQEPSDTLRAQLIDNRSQLDPWYPFVALLVTAVLSDVGETVTSLNPTLMLKFAPQMYDSHPWNAPTVSRHQRTNQDLETLPPLSFSNRFGGRL